MATCLDASLNVVTPQPVSIEACTFVVFSGAEAVQLQASPLNLSLAEAQPIGLAIFVVWTTAFIFRSLRKFIDGWETGQSSQE